MVVDVHFGDCSSDSWIQGGCVGKEFLQAVLKMNTILTPDIVANHDPALVFCILERTI